MACYNDIRDEALLLHLDILKSKVNGYNLSRIKESLNAKLEDAILRYRGSSIDYDDLNSFYEELSKKSGIAKEDLKGYPIESELEPVGYKLQNMVILSKTDNLIGDELSSDFIDDISIENELDLLKMFNNSPDLMQKFLSRFNNDMIDLALFSDEDGMPSFNNSSDSLNQNIANWKSSKSQELLSEILKDYFSKNNSATVATKLSSGKPEDDFIYKAFVSLHFDKLIKLSPKGLIKITRNGYEPNIKTSLRTGWTDNEFINFFDEFGDFSKSIIQSRRMIGLDGKFTGNYLLANVMFNIMNRLYEFTDRTDPQYLDKAIAAILARRLNKSAEIDENYEKLVTNDFLSKFDDEDTEALLSFYIHFMNKGEGSNESNFLYLDNRLKNGSDWKGVHSFHNRSFNSFNSNSYKSSDSIDYYDLIKSGFEKCTSNRYSLVVYDYETRTFKSEDLNTNMSNKRKRILLNNANFIVNNLFLNNSAEFKKNELFVDFLNQFGSDVTIDEFTLTGKFTIDGVQFNMNVEGQTGTYNIIESGDSPIKNNGENIKLLIKSLFGDKTTNVDDYFDFIKNKDNKSTLRKLYESILQALTKTMYCINNKINNQDKTINITDSKDSDSTTVDSQLGSFSRWIGNIAGDEVKAVTSTKDDNFLPSFGIINMAKDIRTLFNFIKKSIKRGKVFFKDNLIFKNIKAVGEPVTNTLISFNDKNVPVAKATGEEIFFNDFMLLFLQRISAGQPVLFQPTTYSDKTKQTAFSFDRDLLYTTKKLNVSNMTISQLSNSFAEQTKGYYDLVISKIKTDLKLILQLDDNYNTLSKILGFIEENKIQESDIINKANQLGLKIVSTMYFEKGKINSLLSELETMNKGDYLSFFENDLNNSIDIMMDNDINIDYSNNKSIFESAIKKMLPKFIEGIDINSFERLWVNKNTDRVIFRNSDGEINPLFKRYFYEHNLCCEPLNQMIIGGVLSHPAKAKGKITLLENFAKRYIAQTKRTVGVLATYHPYRLGQYNGVTYYERIAFVSDPSIMMFNLLGNRTPLETTDGASMSNPLSTILKNNSLLDQGGLVHHKSIGMFVDPENGSFMLMKHADHTITNERIRNSRYSKYNYTRIIKKMLSYDFGDIDITKDFNGRDILSNLNVIYKKNALKVQVSNIIKIDGLPNQYNIILKTTDSVTGVVTTEKKEKILIKNLFDLWNVLGADRSVHISDDGRMIYDDSSWNNLAEFVNKVGFYKSKSNSRTFDFVSKQYPNNPNAYEQFRADITKYRYDDDNNVEYENHRPTADSLYQPLKHAFVGQITYASGEKVGAVNVNPTNVLENDEPFMTYDDHSSIYTGLQLDHEHHTDDSEVTSPTLIITAIMFNGDAYEWNNLVSESMQNMIIANVSNYFESHLKYSELPKDEIRKIIGKHIINELSKKDLSNIATSFASKVQQDIEKLLNEANKKYASDKSAYNGYMEEAGLTSTSNVSFSDPGIYNVVVNSLNNLLTRLGIRNKIAGSMNVLSPCNDFMTIHDRGGKTYLASDFDGVLNYIPIKKLDVKIFDTIRITRKTKLIPLHSLDIKLQIDFLFERNKELNKIGTKEQYENYLLNVFPLSIDKDIYWHGSDSDFSQGFESAKRGAGSGAPEVGNEFYLAKQPWSVLQYVSGVNRKSGPDKNGFNHWNKLWWELKEIMSNGRRDSDNWKNLIIDENSIRLAIPNKKGVFNRDLGGKNGKWLSERKADYGYENKTDAEFFKDVFGIEYGKDTFNSWVARNEETFKDLAKTEKGMYPAIINTVNPIKESGQNTYYEEQRGLKTLAAKNNNDSILGHNTDNEFGSDVAVVFNPQDNIHFLGTSKDLNQFKEWIKNQTDNSFESISQNGLSLRDISMVEIHVPFTKMLMRLGRYDIIDKKDLLKLKEKDKSLPTWDRIGRLSKTFRSLYNVLKNTYGIPKVDFSGFEADVKMPKELKDRYLAVQQKMDKFYKDRVWELPILEDNERSKKIAEEYVSLDKEIASIIHDIIKEAYGIDFQYSKNTYSPDLLEDNGYTDFKSILEKYDKLNELDFKNIKDNININDPEGRVFISKLSHKESLIDVFNSKLNGLTIIAPLDFHPNLLWYINFNKNSKKWEAKILPKSNLNINDLTLDDLDIINNKDYFNDSSIHLLLLRYIPYELSKYLNSLEYKENKDDNISKDKFKNEWDILTIDEQEYQANDLSKNTSEDRQFHQEELYIKDYDTFQKFRELEGEFEVEKVEGAGRRLLPHRVLYNVLIDDKTDIFDPKERVKLSKLLNKEEILDVVNSVDGGLAISISLKNHPNFQAVLFFNDHGDKRNWKLQVQPREGVNVNNLSKEEQLFYNENSIISKEDVQKFLDRYIPKDMLDYLTSEQYNQDHIESVMFPSGKDINKTHIGVDNHLRDNWGIHFINEYTDESNYISRSIEKTKDTFSTDFIRLLNDVKLINDKTGEDKKNAIFQYLAALKLSSNFLLGNENSEIYKSIVKLVDEFSDKKIEFNENLFNFLKNLQLLAYKKLKENHQTLDSMYDYAIEHNLDINNVAIDVLNNKLTIDDFTQLISNYTELPAEVIMPANVAHNFMVKEGDVITDINEDFYKKRISNAIGNKVLDHKTLIDHNGKNITIITPEEFAALDKRGIKTSYKYLSENGKNYIVNKKYEKISQIGDLQFYDFKDGIYKRVVVLSNPSDMIYLQNFDDGVGRYGFIFDPAVDRDSQIEKLANIMNAAFLTSLYGSMCRIPSQSKQSGMPMKIVGFMLTENNVSFVPPENLYLTGGDFDIDKIVQVLLSFKRNGKPVLFNDYVDLMNHVSILTSLSLPLSDYKEREIVDEKYTGDDALLLSDNEISLLNSSIDKDGNPDISNLTPDDFKSFSLLMHKIKAFDKIKIARPEGWTPSFKNDIYDNAENAILTFFESGRKHLNDSEAMQAATVATLYHAYNDGRNAIHTYAPMEADKIKGVIDSITNISEEEKKAGITEEDKPKNWMKIYSPTNVLTDIMMQIANMTGKDGISRAATGQKALGVIHDRFLKIGEGKTENIFFNNTMPQEVALAIGVSDLDVEFMTNGFNTYNMLDNINKFIQLNFAEDSVELLIKKSYEAALQQSDSSLDMSSLITLSTDNAKELALGKINATSDTLGMYCYAVAMGVNIEHFTRFMTHPTITALVNNAKSNLIQPEKRKNSFDTSIKEIKLGYLEPWKYNNLLQERLPKIISSINKLMNSNLKLKDFLYNIVNNGQFDYIRREILNNPKFKLTVSSVLKSEDDDYIDENGNSRNLRNDFARWLLDSINLSEKLGFKDINVKMASLFEKIQNESEALKVFGQLLGINQSIKSDSYDFYKYLNILPDYIEKVKSRLKDEIENNSILKDSEKRAYLDSIKYLFGGRMDFNRFILNEDYRNKCIEDYKSLTKNSQINILECLAGSKHFMEMISLACSSDLTLLPIASVKYKTLKSMISDSVNGKFFSLEGENSKSVSENIYRKLSSYIDDLIIQDFFDSNLMTVYPEANDTYSIISNKKTINVKSKGQPFDLTTMQGRSEFTSWFENKMMFDIKNIDSLKNNKFVQMLTIDAKEDTNLGKTYYFLKPSLNYDPNHNDLYKNIVADMVKGLQELNNVKINLHKVSDLFFLYDLIVNRGKKNSNSFAYFNSLATNINDKSTLASAYNNHIVSMDRDGIKLDYNRFDFINRGIAEVKRTDKQTHIFQVKQLYNQEKKKNDNTYYVREADGKDYKVELDENAIIKNIPVKTTITRSVDMKSITSMFDDLNDGLIIIKC